MISVMSHSMLKSDTRADVLAEDITLASHFIKTLFGVLYNVYNSSVSDGHIVCFDFKIICITKYQVEPIANYSRIIYKNHVRCTYNYIVLYHVSVSSFIYCRQSKS